jgi:hypothetical protein
VNSKFLMVMRDSIVEIPVSLAPTTMIRLFTHYFGTLRDFLLIMLRAKIESS